MLRPLGSHFRSNTGDSDDQILMPLKHWAFMAGIISVGEIGGPSCTSGLVKPRNPHSLLCFNAMTGHSSCFRFVEHDSVGARVTPRKSIEVIGLGFGLAKHQTCVLASRESYGQIHEIAVVAQLANTRAPFALKPLTGKMCSCLLLTRHSSTGFRRMGVVVIRVDAFDAIEPVDMCIEFEV